VCIVGERTIHWTSDTVRALLKLCRKVELVPPSVLRWLPASRPESEDLLSVLYRGRNCSATNPRDKVYALLGLIDQRVSDAITVDYNQSPEDTFISLAVYLLGTQRRIDILLHVKDQSLDTRSFPSWVPRWDTKCIYEASPPQFSDWDTERLATSWFEIKKTAEPNQSSPVQRQFVSSPGIHDIQLRHRSVHEADHGPLFLPYVKTKAHHLDTITTLPPLAASESHSHFNHVMLSHVHDGTETCSSCKAERSEQPSLAISGESSGWQIGPFWDTVERLGGGCTRFVTDQSVGFVKEWPLGEHIRVGDTIWALPGLKAPIILRQEEAHYVFIGECYLFRAAESNKCRDCGLVTPWAMHTEFIDIW